MTKKRRFVIDLNILYNQVTDLPKLAWLACLILDGKTLEVFHGSSVECHDDWMVEGVWDGEFEQGEFHRSENFFGSGIRIEDDKVYFVPSSAMVDRLFYCVDKGKIIVSNSLLILLGFTGATLDKSHDYNEESLSILKGSRDYTKEFAIIHPEIRCFYQVFFENIVVSEDGISFEARNRLYKIDSFDQYYKLLSKALLRIKKNYESAARKLPVSAFTTISSGYDSTAVACLVKNIGVKTCFTSRKSNSWIPSWIPKYSIDDGTHAAESLQFNIRYLSSPFSKISEDELYFIANTYAKFSDAKTLSELDFHSMATFIEKNCELALVFSGYHGDVVWDVNKDEKYLNDQIIRADTAGLSLSEIRLKSGFIHVPVPFMFARNIKELIKISRSQEMQPWRLNNSYDRPIARRIAETSGVDRHAFGQWKKGLARPFYRYPINPQLRKRFFEFVKKNYHISSGFIYLLNTLNQIALFIQKVLKNVGLRSGGYKRTVFLRDVDFYYLMWIWSAGVLSQRFANIFSKYNGAFRNDVVDSH